MDIETTDAIQLIVNQIQNMKDIGKHPIKILMRTRTFWKLDIKGYITQYTKGDEYGCTAFGLEVINSEKVFLPEVVTKEDESNLMYLKWVNERKRSGKWNNVVLK